MTTELNQTNHTALLQDLEGTMLCIASDKDQHSFTFELEEATSAEEYCGGFITASNLDFQRMSAADFLSSTGRLAQLVRGEIGSAHDVMAETRCFLEGDFLRAAHDDIKAAVGDAQYNNLFPNFSCLLFDDQETVRSIGHNYLQVQNFFTVLLKNIHDQFSDRPDVVKVTESGLKTLSGLAVKIQKMFDEVTSGKRNSEALSGLVKRLDEAVAEDLAKVLADFAKIKEINSL